MDLIGLDETYWNIAKRVSFMYLITNGKPLFSSKRRNLFWINSNKLSTIIMSKDFVRCFIILLHLLIIALKLPLLLNCTFPTKLWERLLNFKGVLMLLFKFELSLGIIF